MDFVQLILGALVERDDFDTTTFDSELGAIKVKERPVVHQNRFLIKHNITKDQHRKLDLIWNLPFSESKEDFDNALEIIAFARRWFTVKQAKEHKQAKIDLRTVLGEVVLYKIESGIKMKYATIVDDLLSRLV